MTQGNAEMPRRNIAFASLRHRPYPSDITKIWCLPALSQMDPNVTGQPPQYQDKKAPNVQKHLATIPNACKSSLH